MFVDAFKAYRHTDPSAAVNCIDVAIERFLAQGNLLRAARHTEMKAMLLEKLDDKPGASEIYCKAAGYFESDGTVV
jgi:alpha-soluble NSF attachment protein